MKRGDIWISAVLYMALGIIAISLILTAGLPLIEKAKDRNTVIQTKNLMFTLDEKIKTVANEGPGSQRELNPFIINSGKLIIDENNDRITWTMETKARLSEPNILIEEGSLNMLLNKTFVKDKFNINLFLNYNDIDLKLNSPFGNPFTGKYKTVIKHTGQFTGNKPIIEIVLT